MLPVQLAVGFYDRRCNGWMGSWR